MTGTLPKDLMYIYGNIVISRWILLRRRNVSSNSCREDQNRFCIQKSCHLRDNVLKCGTARQAADDSIIQRMRFECCTSKVIDTNSEYVFFFTTTTVVMQTCLSIMLYVHYLSFLKFCLYHLCYTEAHFYSSVVILQNVCVTCHTCN
jgi:hypothetical protein